MTWWRWITEHFDDELVKLGDTPVTPSSIVVFALSLLVAVILGSLARRGIEAFFRRRARTSEGLGYALARITQYLVLVVGLLVGLQNVGIDLTALAAGGAVVAVGIGLGLQSIAQNFISGVILLVERPVQKGDFVIVGDTVGTVQEIAMRATRVVTRDGVSILVPNSELVAHRVINQSAPTSTYRVRIAVGVEYGSDTESTRETLLAVAAEHPAVLKEPAPRVFFRDFGDSALLFELAVWLDDPQPEPAVTSDLRFAIDAAFRERGIVIAFPQRDLHLKTGWEKLRPGEREPGARQPVPSSEREGETHKAPAARPAVRDTSAEEKATVERVVREKDRARREELEDEGEDEDE